jgi:hypothetical protein
MFTDSRLPVPATTGVRPTGAQVVPEWWSVRTLFLLPAAHPLGVLFVGAHQGALRGQPETAQQLADSLPGVAHPELPFDHLTHQIPGPQGEVQLELPRIAPHDGPAQLGHLPFGELRLGAG